MAMAPASGAVAAPANDSALDPVAQCALATLNVMRLLHDSSPCKSLERLPRDLSAKLPSIRNTGSLLHQMPAVVISLDTCLDSAVQNARLLKDVRRLLSSENSEKSLESERNEDASQEKQVTSIN
ncbi:tobamovirus multiplication protein 2B-like isoform X1 [Selaginella moellendorffii]|uniref:tobamovirus multiplication protein 2B-like isoform X1 n=1 Tax=Selaginella moellendorffii TaxID=88036 RepID=UPI000D1C6715|nr:tobamovirus multiplication protein 2B-like isoform X1 [Selaginella moellendorffii]|eukprot:XP_024516042.1 tobamovirus multiplication protein 2B-like isoform X1 [Selaginella moellendorffii]